MTWCKEKDGWTIYFHNLKFDGSFIVNWLLLHNYPYTTEKLKKHDKIGFTTLIDEMGAWYSITANLERRVQVNFCDSLKIIPLKVKEIAKAFNLPIEKEIIDYQDYKVTPQKWEYIEHDVKIPAMALKFFKGQGYTKMTIGGCSYESFENSDRQIKKQFPILDRDWVQLWRKAYRGGRTQANPRFANQLVHNVRRFDINSMYSYGMSRFPMPYGSPIRLTKRTIGLYNFELYRVAIAFSLKEGHLPTLLKKTGLHLGNDTYYKDTDGVEEIYISNIDLELVKRHYDIKYLDILEGYGFYTDKNIFRDWVDEHYRFKQESKGGLRMVYKLIINNLYGKFGSNAKGRQKIPFLDDRDESNHFKNGELEDMRIYYLPVAIAITSYCHKLIDDAILKTGYENFVYCDTDSVHTLGSLPNEWIDDKEIGKFKMEAIETKAKYVRQKCYITKEGDPLRWHITCCGMPDSIKQYLIDNYSEGDMIEDIFQEGLKVKAKDVPRDSAKLCPIQVHGGCVLKPIDFTLRTYD